jgi:hypothetical protein
MASLGHGHHVVILAPVGSASRLDIKLVLHQREAQSGRVWFPYGGVLPSETHVVVIVRETALPLTTDDLQLT